MNTIKAFTAIITLVAFASCASKDSVSEQSSYKEKTIPVTVSEVVEKPLSITIETQGRLSASQKSELSFKYAGIIAKILVNEGQQVRKNQTLASLDLVEINAQLNQARVAFEKAERDLQRMKNLYKEKVITLESLQNSETAFEIAKSSMEIIEFNKKFSTIVAPADGQIMALMAEENELVNPGKVIFSFASTSESWVMKVGLVDRDVVKIEQGDTATILFDAFPEQAIRAEVFIIPNAPNPVSGTYEVELRLKEFSSRLKSGFYGKVQIYPSAQESYKLLPLEALIEGKGREGYVFVPDGDRVRKEKVHVIEFVGEMLAISNSDMSFNKVVVHGAAELREDSRIEVIH